MNKDVKSSTVSIFKNVAVITVSQIFCLVLYAGVFYVQNPYGKLQLQRISQAMCIIGIAYNFSVDDFYKNNEGGNEIQTSNMSTLIDFSPDASPRGIAPLRKSSSTIITIANK